MKRFMVLMLCASVIPMTIAQGEEKQTTPAASSQLKVVEMSISPAQHPRPALKWRLLPEVLEQTPQDAVPLYLKAMLLMENKDPKFWDGVCKWLETPVGKLPRDEVRAALGHLKDALRYVEMGSRRSICNWAVPLQEEEQVFAIMLPEMQKVRNLGRLVALRARLEIAEGRYTEAIGTLQTGYALARHAAEQQLLISGLVGISIANVMNEQLAALMQSPQAPNLYWAVTSLPDPLIDMRQGLEGEAVWLYYYFRKAHECIHSPPATSQQWQAAFDELLPKIRTLSKMDGNSDSSSEPLKLWEKALVQSVAAVATPYGRQNLIARGRPNKEVQAMSSAQVIILDFFETYDDYRDELFRWFHVPYWQAREGIAKAEERLHKDANDKAGLIRRPGTILAALMLPAVGRCHAKQAILRREIAALRCIEAIRLYAAGHQGKLPTQLSDIAEVPIPINPVTGVAFPYRVEGGVAILLADGPVDERRTEYRIKLVNP